MRELIRICPKIQFFNFEFLVLFETGEGVLG